MFVLNDDLSIYITRGDAASFTLPVIHNFKANDVVRFQIFRKKDCTDVVLRKDFQVEEATDQFEIVLTGTDTKLDDIISKPTDYWYEVEVNPGENSKTIIGYDEDGAKVFKLFPEGDDGILTYKEYVESAYTIAVAHGYEGTEEEWLASLKGEKGAKGDKGDKGDTGVQGIQGIQGIQGEKGEKGDKGDRGAQGIQGVKGDKGEKGDVGAQGIQGIQGEKGDKGDKGDTGNSGVYIGSGDMPADCNVQIDPNGEASTIVQTTGASKIAVMSQKAVTEAIPTKVSQFDNDSGYLTESDLPKNVSEFENDVGYVKSENNGNVSISTTNGNVELKTLVSGLPAYIRTNGNLQAEVFGVGGVKIWSASNVEITQLKDPTNDTDAANKKYVDDAANSAIADSKEYTDNSVAEIRKSIPTKVSELANDKGYIINDDKSASKITLFGNEDVKIESAYKNVTLSSGHGNVVVKKLIDPTDDADAANKKYVDDKTTLIFQTPTSTVTRLDDSDAVPFEELNAPNGSTVSVYGKNLLERKFRSDGEDDVYLVYTSDNGTQYFGYRTGSLSAGDYTVKFVCKDETVKPAYIYVNVDYADGTRLPNTLVMIYASTQDYTANPLKLTLEKSGQIFIYAAGATSYIQGARKEFGKMATLQIEAGAIATAYEEYKEPKTVTMPVAEMPTAYSPTTTIVCNEGCSVKYKADAVNAYTKLLNRIAALEAATVNNI